METARTWEFRNRTIAVSSSQAKCNGRIITFSPGAVRFICRRFSVQFSGIRGIIAGYGLCVYLYMVIVRFLRRVSTMDRYKAVDRPSRDSTEIVCLLCVPSAMHRNCTDIARRPLRLPYGGRVDIVRWLCDPCVFLEMRVPKV